ncbi:MAG: Na+/H+ antiporter NhaC family protein [Bacillota bacterium]|nr:Na+/H+ antiporter NhaC family protein [Bacillota bacterium]
MNLTAAVIFLISMILCLAKGISMIIPLLAGYGLFFCLALKKGCPAKKLLRVSVYSMKNTLIVVQILLIIGILTASWRSGGTILYFVYWGVKLITPRFFLIIAFLVTCLMSYSIGSSFGVACTLGVIFMSLARSGSVNEAVAAGVIISGIYFGDRASPAASSLILTAALTESDSLENVKKLMKTGLIPYGICIAVYTFLSLKNPLDKVDSAILNSITENFNMSFWLAVPALIMLILPLLKVNIKLTMLLSIGASGVISIFLQKVSLIDFLYFCTAGYRCSVDGLGRMLNGGGLFSMLEICAILLISCTYSAIFKESGILSDIDKKTESLMIKWGRFPVHLLYSAVFCAVFCNQTIAIMMSSAVCSGAYKSTGASGSELAVDIGNSTVVVAGLVPWCIACSVPLSFLGTGIEALPYAVLLYSIPLWNLLRSSVRRSRDR